MNFWLIKLIDTDLSQFLVSGSRGLKFIYSTVKPSPKICACTSSSEKKKDHLCGAGYLLMVTAGSTCTRTHTREHTPNSFISGEQIRNNVQSLNYTAPKVN